MLSIIFGVIALLWPMLFVPFAVLSFNFRRSCSCVCKTTGQLRVMRHDLKIPPQPMIAVGAAFFFVVFAVPALSAL